MALTDWKTMALGLTATGTVLISGLTFTGAIDLDKIRNTAQGWASNINTSVDETSQMLEKFNVFKSSVTDQLNERIAKINELNAKLAELKSSGEGDIAQANSEIVRLNEQLEIANQEVKALADELGLTDEQVQAKMTELKTDDMMDTTLTLIDQNPDTVIEETTTTEPTPTEPEPTVPTEPVNDYTTEETAIKNAILANHMYVQGLTVTMTDTTVTLASTNSFSGLTIDEFDEEINSSITGKTVSNWTNTNSNTFTYTLQ
jgi:uncharacterized protein YoxC